MVGVSAQIKCNYFNHRWLKDGDSLPNGIELYNQTLVIPKIRELHHGEYRCYHSNGRDSVASMVYVASKEIILSS